MELTAPEEVPVVEAAKIVDPHRPKRTSLPSIEPDAPAAADTSAHVVRATLPSHSRPANDVRAQPWRRSPTTIPNVRVSANGMTSIRKTAQRFVNGVGFSKGCEELALK